jgi:DNA-binding NarL/FixJ family response regulator
VNDEGRRTAVILDALPMWLEALADMAEASEIEVIARVRQREQALALVREHQPGLFVCEVGETSREDDLSAVRRARRADGTLKILVISACDATEDITAAFTSGADVYALKSSDPADIAAAMRQAFQQSFYVASPWLSLPGAVVRPANGPAVTLTKREYEVLQLVSEGHTNVEVASMLWVTEQTIKFHLSNLYRKIQVGNRTEAARWARDNGILKRGPIAEVV